MHSYRPTERGYIVGFEFPGLVSQEGPQMNFRTIKTFQSEEHAAHYASFLNGGAVPTNFSIKWDAMLP